MDLKKSLRRGKKVVDDRGGVDSLKEDDEELQGMPRPRGQPQRPSQRRPRGNKLRRAGRRGEKTKPAREDSTRPASNQGLSTIPGQGRNSLRA